MDAYVTVYKASAFTSMSSWDLDNNPVEVALNSLAVLEKEGTP